MLALSWQRFYSHFKTDVKLWCYFIILQQICRLSFIYLLSNYLAPTTTSITICQAMLHGLRFDSLWATVWLFIPLILITLPSVIVDCRYTNHLTNDKFRYYLGAIFTTITLLIYIVSIEYYREYKDVFNQFLFCFFYDDKIAIIKTIFAEHHVLLYITAFSTILILYVKYSPKLKIINSSAVPQLIFSTKKNHTKLQKIIITTFIILFYIIGFRGSIGPRPIQLKDAGVTTDAFLNKAIISPYSSLKYATKEYIAINSQENYMYATNNQQSIIELAKNFFNKNCEYQTLAKYMQQTAKGSLLQQPKHVFLIIGESLDAWPLQKKYAPFNLTPNLHKLIKNGLHLKYFLPCSNGTTGTLNTIITGLPDIDLHTNYQPNSYQPYPTALAIQFKKLGFKSQFFYGGYLSWQRLEDFTYAQGFDAVYGASHISNWQQTNEWGVDDKTLFKFITNTIQSATTPTFNVIMTTSNHPPFSIDLQQEGFHINKAEKLLTQYPNTTTNVKELGHIWYADKAIGEFVTTITGKYHNALFAITGDHFGRKHILPNPPLFDVSAVPLIFYGNKIQNYYKFPHATAGSHLDLSATLFELVAPKGAIYYTMGENLFSAKNHWFGIGQQKIITAELIASTTSSNIMYLHKNKQNMTLEKLPQLIQKHDQAMSIAWWLIKKGELYEHSK